ncbi:D-alanyl-D-alanine carboxypeptidase/D-alanyl-D-alanine-endopeptidase [Psychrobacter lutiphocae]|uniref:D-alanyl-D-alanine carboxypeptidase/D-alanyl-D-alanine-endopeptidase n=1 Tax=Psychrobacter lutiphocae TaxID=540500 RepID=UPI00036A3E87|nr:D-alanyl-D-alanine carboxypeptidase [Psychrobacter lutiphocae]
MSFIKVTDAANIVKAKTSNTIKPMLADKAVRADKAVKVPNLQPSYFVNSPSYFANKHQPSSNQGIKKTTSAITKIAATLSLIFATSITAYAQLPPPVEHALSKANISTDDISLVVVPVFQTQHVHSENQQHNSSQPSNSQSSNSQPSRLAKLVVPRPSSLAQPDSADALPPEQAPTLNTSASAAHSATISTSTSSANGGSGGDSSIAINKSTATNTASVTTTSTQDQYLQKNQEKTQAKIQTKPTNNEPLQHPIRHLANVSRTPASTMKLIPTFVALDLLGADFTWFTKVYHTGFIFGNTLYGDLIIQGSGDPKLTHQRLAMLLQQVEDYGIHHINGNIILDSSVFQGVTKDPAAFDNDPLRPYNASPDGLLVNFSTVYLAALPLLNEAQQGLAKAYYQPMLADYELPDILPIRYSGHCSTALSTLTPRWMPDKLTFNQALPDTCNGGNFFIAYPDAKDFAARVIKYQWLNLGNSLTGNIKFLGLSNTLTGTVINTESPHKTKYGTYLGTRITSNVINKNHEDKNDAKLSARQHFSLIPAVPLPFVSFPSLPLSQQIHDINHYSNNVMTEQLTLTLPLFVNASTLEASNYVDSKAIKTQQDTYSNYTKALATINHWWQKKLQTPAPVMTNGSGLCRDCFVTADNLAELLSFAYQHPSFETYANSLGIAGISGTIAEHAKRLPNSKAIGQAWIKTGTLNNVTSMAGYVHGQSGQDYVIVGIINSNRGQPLNTYEARYVLDTLLDWTAQH